MKAITTKYIGPSNVRGSRIKAFDGDGHSVTLSYDPAINSDQNHLKAACALRDKMQWKGKLIGGGTKTGYVFCFADSWLREE